MEVEERQKTGIAWKHLSHDVDTRCMDMPDIRWTWGRHKSSHSNNVLDFTIQYSRHYTKPQTFTRLQVLHLTGKKLTLRFIVNIFVVIHDHVISVPRWSLFFCHSSASMYRTVENFRGPKLLRIWRFCGYSQQLLCEQSVKVFSTRIVFSTKFSPSKVSCYNIIRNAYWSLRKSGLVAISRLYRYRPLVL